MTSLTAEDLPNLPFPPSHLPSYHDYSSLRTLSPEFPAARAEDLALYWERLAEETHRARGRTRRTA